MTKRRHDNLPNGFLGAILLSPLLCLSLHAKGIEIRATLVVSTRHVEDVSPDKEPRRIAIVCIIGEADWSIQNDFAKGGTTLWYGDTTNTYQALQGVGSNRRTIYAYPSYDGHPPGNMPVNIPWLAFCSGKFLKQEERTIPLPCTDLRHAMDRFAYADKMELNEKVPGLPVSIDLRFSTSRYLKSVDDFYAGWGERYLEWMKAAVTNFQEGERVFSYRATAWTNFQGQAFPLKFEFAQEPRTIHPTLNVRWRGSGEVTSITESDGPSSPFAAGFDNFVIDKRFDEAVGPTGAVKYQWNEPFPPSIEDPVVQTALELSVIGRWRR